ncbi:MAG: purine-binding chemotaxis protein CheW [Deltaproteobacteria bacterium]|nr:purine-binding chemotaxis protein CheW [Deltaproteobacteria bacterium]
MQEKNSDAADVRALATEHKCLTFHLADELYGLDILKVREIIGIQEVTKVPGAEEYLIGVINLRGKVIPVADLRKRFVLPVREYDVRTCIIVVEIAGEAGPVAIGIVVDAVDAVVNLRDEQVEKAPVFASQVNRDCIRGLGKFDKQVVILLDIDKVCATGQTAAEDAPERRGESRN